MQDSSLWNYVYTNEAESEEFEHRNLKESTYYVEMDDGIKLAVNVLPTGES